MQLNKLRQELSHLASEKASITVLSGNSRSSGELKALWHLFHVFENCGSILMVECDLSFG